jgi:kynurenine 3-monooxygenase
MREDPRTLEHFSGKSINLSISERGISALRSLGLEESFIQNYSIKMKSRLIHDLNGTKREIPYGRKDQFILSVGRRFLNELLLTEAEKYKNINIHFSHKLIATDLDKGMTLLIELILFLTINKIKVKILVILTKR